MIPLTVADVVVNDGCEQFGFLAEGPDRLSVLFGTAIGGRDRQRPARWRSSSDRQMYFTGEMRMRA